MRARGRERKNEREKMKKKKSTYFSCKRDIVFCHYLHLQHTSHPKYTYINI